jgi:hypothetical protein
MPALFGVGCAEPLELEGRHCPCAEGYQCCESGNVCMRESETCPSWRPLDEASLDALDFNAVPTGWTFEVAADGTPYLAVLNCKSGDCFDRTRVVPTVMRYEQGAWTTLPSDGLPETVTPPALIVEANGTLHLLSDVTDDEGLVPRSIVSTFDGVRWEQRGSPLPGEAPLTVDLAAGPFALDDSNRLMTAIVDPSGLATRLSIWRLEDSGWQVLGTPINNDNSGVQIASRNETVCVTHLDGLAATLLCLDESEWRVVKEFERTLARGFFIRPDGTFVVAHSLFLSTNVMFGKNDEWIELPPVQSQRAELSVTQDGGVFLFAQGFDVPSRVAFWDEELDEWGYLTNAGIHEDALVYDGSSKFVAAEAAKTPYLAIYFRTGGGYELRVWKHE